MPVDLTSGPENTPRTITLTSADAVAALIAVLLLLVIAELVLAHPVLVPKPTQTTADRLLQSETLVLAREDPNRPFHYAAVRTLKGELGSASIDLFIPSNQRRRLAAEPGLMTLLGRTSAEDDWMSFGFATDGFMAMVKSVLDSAEQWTPNETDNLPRLKTFSALLGHKDIRLHKLAYLEIGRATYESIRTVGEGVELSRVRSMFARPQYYQWRGLDIMLLGLSDDEQDRSFILQAMQAIQSQSRTSSLAAWATAYVEVQGPGGIADIERWYFSDATRSREELQSVARALAGHANEAPSLRDPVVAAYQEMLTTHPLAAPDIVHDLIAWQRWDLYEQVTQLKPEIARNDPLGVYKIELYLRHAGARHRANQL